YLCDTAVFFDYQHRYMAIVNGSSDPFGYVVEGEAEGWREWNPYWSGAGTWMTAMFDQYWSSYYSMDDWEAYVNIAVTLDAPSDNHSTSNTTITFNCSAMDNLNLVNITLYGNWSGGWHANETVNITGTSNSTTFTKTLSTGSYKWNCLAYDDDSNSDWGDSNFTITTGVDTTYPQFSNYWDDNTTLTDSGTGNFNVTVADTNGTVLLEINGTNVTATNLSTSIYNVPYTFSSSGTYPYKWHSWGNGTSENYNVSTEQSYVVNDTISPIISLVLPTNSSTQTSSSTVIFTYNVSDTNLVSNCSLFIDGVIDQTDTIITKDVNQTFSKSMSNANYNWSVKCYDSSDNQGNSSLYYLTVSYTAPAAEESSSGGGGGGGGETIIVTNETLETIEIITPGNVTIIEGFDLETAIKQIKVKVKAQVSNVSFRAEKFDEKPIDVANHLPEYTGKVYKYLQIEPENFNDSLELATVTFQVLKGWMIENNVEKNNVVIYKFDEEYEVWNELGTNFIESPIRDDFGSPDEEYYYYEVELESFSYFAIVEKVVVEEAEVEGVSLREGVLDLFEKVVRVIGFVKRNWIWFIGGLGIILFLSVGVVFGVRRIKEKRAGKVKVFKKYEKRVKGDKGKKRVGK
ncbi:PGF-pre-PGF domain-containing protein, partial [Candidatus Pacearchaeota archaeon]|nr:PGF-pre-PGF domain-containing protein [Candidatus Pacearchaeota archaeon]